MRRDVYIAIADPKRRKMLDLLSRQRLNLNAIAERFDISRPAVSKHIKILEECGLVRIKQEGRERYCEASLRSLQKVSKWIDQYRVFWAIKLDALENYLDEKNKNLKDHNHEK